MVLPYKYDFELSSKRKIFLWLYQVLPNIDIIKYIYQLKEVSELDYNQIYHGLCPKHVTTCGKWIPVNINNNYKIMTIENKMKINAILMKIIMKPGFIGSFTYKEEDYCNIELNEIDFGNWFSVVPNINFKPLLKDKINCIETILKEEPYVSEDICIKLNHLCDLFSNNEIMRIGFDQYGNYYLPSIYV
mgnify:FL=1